MGKLIDLAERIENLRDRYDWHDKEALLDDIANAFDAKEISKDQAVEFFTQVNAIAMKAFD